jgi:DUF4097 and DUF4098 domain-containing protein YvlB
MAAPLVFLALTLVGSAADTTLHLPRNGAVEIDSRMRDVTVRTGTGDVVSIRGASGELDGGTLSISGDDRHNRGGGGLIEVTVPVWARVEVSTVGGNLTFVGMPEKVDAETVTGFVRTTGGSGTADLQSVAGPVTVADFHGSKLSIDATGAVVTVTNSSGAMEIDNVTGGIVLHGIRSTSISASTVNDGIDFEGSFAPTGSYDFASQNGDVTLTVGADVSARLKITTLNGEFRSPQIAATTNGTISNNGADRHSGKGKHHDDDDERAFTATYGSGSARVTIDVFNGNVIVRKKP